MMSKDKLVKVTFWYCRYLLSRKNWSREIDFEHNVRSWILSLTLSLMLVKNFKPPSRSKLHATSTCFCKTLCHYVLPYSQHGERLKHLELNSLLLRSWDFSLFDNDWIACDEIDISFQFIAIFLRYSCGVNEIFGNLIAL